MTRVQIPSGALFDYEYESKKWGSIFLQVDSLLLEETRLEVIVAATEMFLGNKRKLQIQGKGYRGTLMTDGKYVLLGCYHGQVYRARMHTPCGKSAVSFMIAERVNPYRN